jgi:hypothetical protein
MLRCRSNSICFGQSSRGAGLLAAQIDLGIDTAQLVFRPPAHRIPDFFVDPERKAFYWPCLVVIGWINWYQYRLPALITSWHFLTAQHHQQIAHHARLALFVE